MRWPIISPVVFHLSSTRYIKGGQMNFSRISAASIFVSLVLAGTGMTSPVQAQQANMTFFVTSAGKGNGADLGGLEGADAHCAALAKAAGAKATNWHAYLSTTLPGGDAGVNARDRIGKGPWRHPERARHPHRLGSGGHVLHGGRRHHLRQLDQERRRLGHRRSPRPAGVEGHAAHEVVELLARLARLQPGPAESFGRRRLALLLRRELTGRPGRSDEPTGQAFAGRNQP